MDLACGSLTVVNEIPFPDTLAAVLGCFLASDMWRKERTACFIGKKDKSLLRMGKLQKRKLSTDYFAQKDPLI